MYVSKWSSNNCKQLNNKLLTSRWFKCAGSCGVGVHRGGVGNAAGHHRHRGTGPVLGGVRARSRRHILRISHGRQVHGGRLFSRSD